MKKSSACLIALFLLWTSLPRVSFATTAETSTAASAKAAMPITLIKFSVDQLMSPGTLNHPAILGDAADAILSFHHIFDGQSPAVVLFSRVGNQVLSLPDRVQTQGLAELEKKLEAGPEKKTKSVKITASLDVTRPGTFHALDASIEFVDHLKEKLKAGQVLEAHADFKRVYDAAAPGAVLTLVVPETQAAASLKPTDGFVLIPPGEVQMGSKDDEEGRHDDEVLHTAILKHYIEVAKNPTTQGEFLNDMGYNPSNFRSTKHSDGDYTVIGLEGHNVHHPVETVSWFESVESLNRRSVRDGLEPAYIITKDGKGRITDVQVNGPSIYETKGYAEDRAGYRLPTEAEQQYYRKAGTKTPYSFGGADKLDDNAWHKGNSNERTHAVGLKPANPWGLNDTHGNVWEWGNDWHGEHTTETVIDPVGPVMGSRRVLGGGSWFNDARYLRSALRDDGGPGRRYGSFGFRAVRSRNPLALGRSNP